MAWNEKSVEGIEWYNMRNTQEAKSYVETPPPVYDHTNDVIPDPDYVDSGPPNPPTSTLPDHLAKRFSQGKLRYDLIPPEALEALAIICGDGAESHGEDNWYRGMPHKTTYASLMRHLQAWWKGEDNDPTPPYRSHSWAIFWNSMVLVVMEARLKAGDQKLKPEEIDNRPYKAMPPSPSVKNFLGWV